MKMNWKDNRETNTVCFNDIRIGGVFVKNNLIHIKINEQEAFDIHNNGTVIFDQIEKVKERKATLVLD
jgi:hypothetical protein